MNQNRIKHLFRQKNKNILSVFFTAGYPDTNDTVPVIQALKEAGVDLIEVGFPFSDPLADGPVIQQSSMIALKNGMNLNLLFQQLSNIRDSVNVPLILMGYLNPVLQFGMENFCEKCEEAGIDGVIIPDLPLQEYLDEYKNLFQKHHLLNIFLITPQTSEQRIKIIDEETEGFIYAVSSAGTTGARKVEALQEDYFSRLRDLKLKSPVLTGFGIGDSESFQKACRYTNGAIIGSAFIKALAENKGIQPTIRNFVNSIRN